jgi:hypothetical protein
MVTLGAVRRRAAGRQVACILDGTVTARRAAADRPRATVAPARLRRQRRGEAAPPQPASAAGMKNRHLTCVL